MAQVSARRLDDKVAVVTGAAGGVGRATVRLFVDLGARVVAEDIDPRVNELACDERGRGRRGCADPVTAEAAVRHAFDRFGGLDILVNNAAVILSKDILETTEEEWDDLMAVNVRGAFHHSRAGFRPCLTRQRLDRQRCVDLRRCRAW